MHQYDLSCNDINRMSFIDLFLSMIKVVSVPILRFLSGENVNFTKYPNIDNPNIIIFVHVRVSLSCIRAVYKIKSTMISRWFGSGWDRGLSGPLPF